MSRDGNSGKSGGGLWGSLGRMFGAGKSDEASKPGPETAPAGDDAVAEEVVEAAPAGGEEDSGDDEPLILGPAMQLVADEAPVDDQSGEPESEAGDQGEDETAAKADDADDADDILNAGGDPADETEDGDMDDDKEQGDGLARSSSESGAALTLVPGGLAAVDSGDDEAQEADQDSGVAGEEAGGEEVGGEEAGGEAEVSESGPDSGPEPAAAPDPRELEDTIRKVIREELEGEIGRRLSENIQRMIRDEVAQAMLRRD